MSDGKRYIDIKKDDHVVATLGYNFPKKQYYIKSYVNDKIVTTTYRKETDDALQVLLSLGISKINDKDIQDGDKVKVIPKYEEDYVSQHDENVIVPVINPEAIESVESSIVEPYETLDESTIYYTVEDNGSYIRSIQFNDWKEYSLEVDCQKGNIFIRNTNILYSLDVNEDTTLRLERFLFFYKDTVGLDLLYHGTSLPADYRAPYAYIRAAYWLLANQYLKPHFYNQIIRENDTEELAYSNIIDMANFNGLSPVICTCTRDAYNEEPIPKEISLITSIDNTSNKITYSPVSEEVQNIDYYKNLRAGNKIEIKNSSYVEEDVTYSSDGIYTINSLDKSSRSITVLEPISATWIRPTCYVRKSILDIEKMERNGNTIRVSTEPTQLVVGDKIIVEGAISGDISCDGEYTISYIDDKVIGVDENVPTDWNGTGAQLYKEVFVGNIVKVSGAIVTLDVTSTLVANDVVNLYNSSHEKGVYTVSSIDGTWAAAGQTDYSTITLPVKQGDMYYVSSGEDVTIDGITWNKGDYLLVKEDVAAGGSLTSAKVQKIDNTEVKMTTSVTGITIPTLYFAEPAETMEINVTSVDTYLTDFISTGSFSVSDFEKCQKYIETLWFIDQEETSKYSSIPLLDGTLHNKMYQLIDTSYSVIIGYTIENAKVTITLNSKGLYSEYYEEGN